MPDGRIVHDAEYYVLYDQHSEKWEAEEKELDAKLEELRRKHGGPPNIIHILWDDTPFGDVGIPALQKVRGYETPNLNRMAAEGMMFTRLYTEPSCTPSRAACITGRHPVRNGMYTVGFPIESGGLSGDEVSIATVLSQVGYSTAFYGKWHLGDTEESYCTNHGFDEALWTPYNQVLSLWNEIGEGANGVMGLKEEMLPKDPYKKDDTFVAKGWIMTLEGKKGEPVKEWRGTSHEDYLAIEEECKKRSLEFVRTNAEAKKPFFLAWWPNLTSFVPSPKKLTKARALYQDNMQYNVDAFVGTLMEELQKLGIAENTLIVAHADNGPMVHHPPPGLGMTDLVYRGGKGDFLEGGVRVPGFAWWPGMIEAGEIAGDIIHETDLYTTFARLAGALPNVPTDRVIDGLDQTALLLNGDTHSRRDYVFVYQGPNLGATVKGDIKKHWISPDPGAASGIGAAFYNLLHDTREMNPMLVNMLHFALGFDRMRARHEVWMRKYPNRPPARGPAFTGVANARSETKAVSQPLVDLKKLPFDPLEYIEQDLPFSVEEARAKD
jgi:arylsulfatase